MLSRQGSYLIFFFFASHQKFFSCANFFFGFEILCSDDKELRCITFTEVEQQQEQKKIIFLFLFCKRHFLLLDKHVDLVTGESKIFFFLETKINPSRKEVIIRTRPLYR